MTESTLLGNASLAGMGIGALGSAVGTYQQAKSAKANLRYQAAMAEINQRLAQMSAEQTMTQGQQQVAASTMRYGQLKGKTRAALAANGVDLGVGSAAEVQASNDIIKDIDKNTIEANAIRSAWGYRIQADNAASEALMGRASASSLSPASAGFTSLLGGATRVASGWYAFNKMAGSAGSSLKPAGWDSSFDNPDNYG